jgi:hypothetical protein
VQQDSKKQNQQKACDLIDYLLATIVHRTNMAQTWFPSQERDFNHERSRTFSLMFLTVFGEQGFVMVVIPNVANDLFVGNWWFFSLINLKLCLKSVWFTGQYSYLDILIFTYRHRKHFLVLNVSLSCNIWIVIQLVFI